MIWLEIIGETLIAETYVIALIKVPTRSPVTPEVWRFRKNRERGEDVRRQARKDFKTRTSSREDFKISRLERIHKRAKEEESEDSRHRKLYHGGNSRRVVKLSLRPRFCRLIRDAGRLAFFFYTIPSYIVMWVTPGHTGGERGVLWTRIASRLWPRRYPAGPERWYTRCFT